MPPLSVQIAPKRSLTVLALVSLLMVVLSYVFVLLLAGVCIALPYVFFQYFEHVPGQLLAVAIGAAVMGLTILWSLLPRWEKFEAPGMLLERAEHPKLFAELDSVAKALNETLPGQVYLTWGVNAFVADRGGMLGFGNQRILGIGLPLFSLLSVSELRAVLAHEFAHFYGGDTQLGPVVYKAQRAMGRTYLNLAKLRAAARLFVIQVAHTIVSSILKLYFEFFLKVINLVSRKQEFRADELAALLAGAGAMREGLKKIHGGAFAWYVYWHSEVHNLLRRGVLPPLGEGFQQFLASPLVTPQLEKAVAAEIHEGKTEPYDSHPPLGERLAAIEKLPEATVAVESQSALALFEDPIAVERKFVDAMDLGLKDKNFRILGWNEIGAKVTIPGWQSLVLTNAKLLQPMTPELIPEELKRLPDLARKIPDPPGELLDQAQRQNRAIYVLSVAVGLRLLERGWRIHAQPGNFFLYNGEDRANVASKIEALIKGELPAAQWVEQCEKWGIAGLSLDSQSS